MDLQPRWSSPEDLERLNDVAANGPNVACSMNRPIFPGETQVVSTAAGRPVPISRYEVQVTVPTGGLITE